MKDLSKVFFVLVALSISGCMSDENEILPGQNTTLELLSFKSQNELNSALLDATYILDKIDKENSRYVESKGIGNLELGSEELVSALKDIKVKYYLNYLEIYKNERSFEFESALDILKVINNENDNVARNELIEKHSKVIFQDENGLIMHRFISDEAASLANKNGQVQINNQIVSLLPKNTVNARDQLTMIGQVVVKPGAWTALIQQQLWKDGSFHGSTIRVYLQVGSQWIPLNVSRLYYSGTFLTGLNVLVPCSTTINPTRTNFNTWLVEDSWSWVGFCSNSTDWEVTQGSFTFDGTFTGLTTRTQPTIVL